MITMWISVGNCQVLSLAVCFILFFVMFKIGTISPRYVCIREKKPDVDTEILSLSNLTLSNPSDLVCVSGIVRTKHGIVTSMSLWRIVRVDVETHQLLKVNDEDVSGVEHKQVLDLSDEGDRWEGDVLDDQPYGWGVLYDKEGEKAYEGFRIGDVGVCYGTQYYADIGVKEYEGEICEGKRWGRGKQYDRNGVVVYDGEWCENSQGCTMEERILYMPDSTMITNVERLTIGDHCCNKEEWTSLKFDCIPQVRELVIGSYSFIHVETVYIIGLKKLEIVTIGSCSFEIRDFKDIRNPNAHFYLTNCPCVRKLSIDRYSFSNYTQCIISNTPLLESITMGSLDDPSRNFAFCSLELKNMPSIKKLLFGRYAFMKCRRVIFQDMPLLETLDIGKSAFSFFGGGKTKLVLSSLPNLRTIYNSGLLENKLSFTFRSPRTITIENIPKLEEVHLFNLPLNYFPAAKCLTI